MTKPTTRYRKTKTAGGKGGRAFDVHVPGQLVRHLTVWWQDQRLRGLQLTMTDNSSHMIGAGHGKRADHQFALDEKIETVTLYRSGYRGGRCDGISFKTNKGNNFKAGNCKGSQVSDYSGGYLGGMFGHAGSDIDQLGLAFALDVTGYFLKDVTYDLSKAKEGGLRPVALDQVVLTNTTPQPKMMSADFEIVRSLTKHWTSTWGIKLGIKAGGEAGVPLLAKGKWEVSAETSFSYAWGKSETTTSKSVAHAGPMEVAPGKSYLCVALVQQGSPDVPYKGTAVLAFSDGSTIS